MEGAGVECLLELETGLEVYMKVLILVIWGGVYQRLRSSDGFMLEVRMRGGIVSFYNLRMTLEQLGGSREEKEKPQPYFRLG